jgi:enoyl-CoA hydratase/carnithine racemase
MVTVGSHNAKAFSTGFNVLAALSRKHNRVLIPMEMIDIFCRILTMNVPTLAVINGHAIAGGLYLA